MRMLLQAISALAALSAIGCGPAAPLAGPRASDLVGCPKLPDAEPCVAVASAVEIGPFKSHVNDARRQGSELIEVRFVPTSRSPALHQLLLYTDREERQFVIAGYPEKETNLFLQFGVIIMKVAPFEPGAGQPFDADLEKRAARKIIAEGADLSTVWEDMTAAAAVLERLGVDYALFGPNSNSAAETVLKYSGYPPTEDPFIWDVASGVDAILYAVRRGNRVCDHPRTSVEQL